MVAVLVDEADVLQGAKERCTVSVSNLMGRKLKEVVDFLVSFQLFSIRESNRFSQFHRRPTKVTRMAKLLPFTQYGCQGTLRGDEIEKTVSRSWL